MEELRRCSRRWHLAGCVAEAHDGVRRRNLAVAGRAASSAVGVPGSLAEGRSVRVRSEELEAFEHERHTLGRERQRAVGDVEVKVRSGRVAGEAERGECVATAHPLAGSDPHASRRQVLVEREATVPQV